MITSNNPEKTKIIGEIIKFVHSSSSRIVNKYIWIQSFKEIPQLKALHEESMKPENKERVDAFGNIDRSLQMFDELRKATMVVLKDGTVNFVIPKGHFIKKEIFITFHLSDLTEKALKSIVQGTYAEMMSC